MTNSQNHASNNGCFSSVLRRLLCAGGLPTHPSSDTDIPNKEVSKMKLLETPSPIRTITTTTTPAGVVARLMGIDSFPSSPKVSLGSIMRKSRSVGSLDFLPNFPLTPHHHHRRVTTALSFRELSGATTFFNDAGKSHLGLTPIPEKSNNLREREGVHTNVTNTTTNNSNKKKKSNKKGTKSQSQRVKVVRNEQEDQVSSLAVLKMRRKRVVNGAKKKLVDDGFPDEQMYKSRNTRYNHPLPKMVKHEKKKKSVLKRRESEYSQEYCIKVLMEVCSLTMVEIDGGVWLDSKVGVNNLQEISYQIAQHILHFLVYEMVDEFCNSL